MEKFTTLATLKEMYLAEKIHIMCRYQRKSLKLTYLEHCFSKFNMFPNHPWILLKDRFRFSESGVEPEVLHFQKPPDDVAVAGPWATP